MIGWLSFNNSPQPKLTTQQIDKKLRQLTVVQEKPQCYANNLLLFSAEKTKTQNMITSKVAPTVKSTSVNVTFDDIAHENTNVDVSSTISEAESTTELVDITPLPIRSATISLSIELAKKTSMSSMNNTINTPPNTTTPLYIQKPDSVAMYNGSSSSLPKSIARIKKNGSPSSISSSSNSLLQKMAHSPKAAAAAFSTSVFANGNIESSLSEKSELSVEDEGGERTSSTAVSTSKSAAVQSLSKRIALSSSASSSKSTESSKSQKITTTTAGTGSDIEILDEDLDNTVAHITIMTEDAQTSNTDKNVLEAADDAFVCDKELQQQQQHEKKENSSLQSKTTVGFWSWLGFTASDDNKRSNGDKTPITEPIEKQKIDHVEAESTTQQKDIALAESSKMAAVDTITDNNITKDDVITKNNSESSKPIEQEIVKEKSAPTRSPWSSYLFSSKPTLKPKEYKEENKANIALAPNTTQRHDSKVEIGPIPNTTTEQNLRKVKSTSSLPPGTVSATTTVSKTTAINHQNQSQLRLSSSNSSFYKRNNIVLPKFDSHFVQVNSEPVVQPPPQSQGNFVTKTIDAINSIFIPPPPDKPEDTTSWIARRMKFKFQNFVEDVKKTAAETNTSPNHPNHNNFIMDKRIVVVGVHGWFPMKLVRSMIGEPTGTSLKFCEQMASSIKLYFKQNHGVVLPDNAITLVPLEGEGKVEDRVNQLYTKLIDNSTWLEAVSSADVVFWATHSQGTPVSMMLLQRLLERGHIHLTRQSVCALAMAGISHGPFPALKASLIVKYFEADAARELFEFMDSDSPISIKFRQSLSYVLKCGVKLVLTGSMQDQVVPLYSAIMSAVNHPNILRSVYIDGHIYAENDFLINLVVFALKLRNHGLSDYNLLTYISEAMAGSLYALEGGHSTIYEDQGVYMTAVKYMFETAPFGKHTRRRFSTASQVSQNNDNIISSSSSNRSITPPTKASTVNTTASQLLAMLPTMTPVAAETEEVKIEPFQAKPQLNPFYLPWALSRICYDPMVLADKGLKSDLGQLLNMFEQWSPTTAKLRELKFRLEPFRTIRLI